MSEWLNEHKFKLAIMHRCKDSMVLIWSLNLTEIEFSWKVSLVRTELGYGTVGNVQRERNKKLENKLNYFVLLDHMLREESYWILKPRGFENVQNVNNSKIYSGKDSTYKMHLQKAWTRTACPDIFCLCVFLRFKEATENYLLDKTLTGPLWALFSSLTYLPGPAEPSWARILQSQFTQNPPTLVTNKFL